MAEETNETVVGRELIEGLAEKIETFAASLDDDERNLLTAALTDQNTLRELVDTEVAGYSFGTPVASYLGSFSGQSIPQIGTALFPSIQGVGATRAKVSALASVRAKVSHFGG